MALSTPFLGRLSTKFISIVLFLIIVPQVCIYLFMSWTTTEVMKNALRDSLQEKSYLVATDIDQYFDQRIHDTRIISQADVLEGDDREKIIQYLTEINSETPYLNDLDIINTDGVVVASSGEQNERGLHLSQYYQSILPLFEKVQQAKQGDVFVSEAQLLDSGAGIIMLTPITDESNTQVIKTLLVEVNFDMITSVVKAFDDRVIGDKHVYVVDNNGRVVVAGDTDMVLLQKLPDLRTNKDLLFHFEEQGQVGSVVYTDSENDVVMAGFADMAEFGVNKAMDWSIIAIAPMDVIIAPFTTLKQVMVLVMFLVLICVVIAMYILSRGIISSVTGLVESAERIDAGDLEHRIIHTKNDEFRILADTMNTTLNNFVIARTRAEEATNEMLKEKELLNVTLHSIGDGVITTDIEGRVVMINQVTEILTGWKKEEAIGVPITDLFVIVHEESRETVNNPVDKVLLTKAIVELASDTILITRDGEEHIIADSAAPIIDDGGVMIGVVLVFRDITEMTLNNREQERLQEMLSHKSKMDAIGQLAGGVAHDFNNMLGGIMGAANLLLSPKRSIDERSKEYVLMILEAANRAADLTEKLMAFGRKGKILSTAINLHTIIQDSVAILSQSIDKNIVITINPHANHSSFIGDITSIQNVIINIGINASHAMKEGGTLTIETSNVNLTAEYCDFSSFSLSPDEYILMHIRDTGTGIDPDDLTKIFDPFFTTKAQGEGTGLGLASVYGTIEDHHGAIDVQSESGVGTEFHIYLPVTRGQVNQNTAHTVYPHFEHTGKIILVDDERLLLVTGAHILEGLGFEVLSYKNGSLALEYYREHMDEVLCIITDMIMPEINGRDLFYKLRELNPLCKVILSSGFVKDEDISELLGLGLSGFIKKPYRESELIELLHVVLDGTSPT
ncbi:MAG: response regulator [Fibrobacterales bacterium]